MVFEDPTGVRILYDPGTTVAGGDDGRLGTIHAVLLSHVHSDHLGNAKLSASPDASDAKCDGSFPKQSTVPGTNLVEIALAKNSAVLVSQDVSGFLNRKFQGKATGCSASGPANELVVPLSQPCVGNIGFGAKRTVTMTAGMPGVQITVVTAIHGNAIDNSFLTPPLSQNLVDNGLSLTLGPPIGYVLTFSNGLSVYLSGDTGQTSDMRTVVNRYYGARLGVLNIGDLFTTGPEEAAFAASELLNLRSVIPSHANEIATSGGQLVPGTKTARFATELRGVRAFLPLSGQTISFDSQANCVTGRGG